MDLYSKLNESAFKLMEDRSLSSKNLLTEEEVEGMEEKSSTPAKMKMKFVKEMTGQFRKGEDVDVVKDGANYNVFRLGVQGAQPVKMNEKQASEFFGDALKEGFGDTMKKIGGGIKTAYDVAKSGYEGAAEGLTGKTSEERALINAKKESVSSLLKFLKLNGINVTDVAVSNVLDQMVEKTKAKSAAKTEPEKIEPAKAPAFKASPPEAKVKPKKARSVAEEELDEEGKSGGFKPGKAKFIDKNAAKPKKAKEIGAFRGGKAGSGTSSPKE
jgi:hypothetical protein